MAGSIETIIVGGGQAGLSTSYYLNQAGREHLVLEKSDHAGNAWREGRWDSFTLVTPNWTFRLPGGEYDGGDPHGYMGQAEIVRRFDDYVARNRLPVACNSAVKQVDRDESGGYRVRTRDAEYHARNLVMATGFFQEGVVPGCAANIPASIVQMHTSSYRSPQALPPGAVLVVGTGQSGMQIAEEIYQSGRKTFLSTSGVARVPRFYRGKDYFDWLHLSGFFEQSLEQVLARTGRRKFVPPTITGRNGGHSLSLHQFYRDGVILMGHVQGYADGRLITAGDLRENIARCDEGGKMMTRRIDDFIQHAGIDAPVEAYPEQQDAFEAQDILALDLEAEGISTIIWACGYRYNASVFSFPILNEKGLPDAQRAAGYPGLYFAGMPLNAPLKSGFLFGVADHAKSIAGQIVGGPHQQPFSQ